MSDQYPIGNVPVFPFYIDIEMLTGFLAALEDGFSLSAEVSQRESESSSRTGASKGSVSTGGILSQLFRLNLEGSFEAISATGGDVERNFVLQHTTTSLLNRLRNQMYAQQLILSIDQFSNTLPPLGAVVELEGVLRPNPLGEFLSTIDQFLKFIPGLAQELTAQKPSGNKKPASAPSRSERNRKAKLETQSVSLDEPINPISLLRELQSEMNQSRLVDVVVNIGAPGVNSGIVTLRRENITDETFESLLGSKCVILGKVTASVGEEEEISTYRRSFIKHMPKEDVETMLNSLSDFPAHATDLQSISIKGPAVQILPLSIFV